MIEKVTAYKVGDTLYHTEQVAKSEEVRSKISELVGEPDRDYAECLVGYRKGWNDAIKRLALSANRAKLKEFL